MTGQQEISKQVQNLINEADSFKIKRGVGSYWIDLFYGGSILYLQIPFEDAEEAFFHSLLQKGTA